MIAVTQGRGNEAGRAYFEKQTARGKDRAPAIRLLRRRISDASSRASAPTTNTQPHKRFFSRALILVECAGGCLT